MIKAFKIFAIVAICAVMLASCTPQPAIAPIPNIPVTQANNAAYPPNDSTWISPGKIQVTNFHAGATVEYPITIHNGKSVLTSFTVKYRYPDHVGDGYSKPVSDAGSWVTIAEPIPVLTPFETRDVMVSITLPNDVKDLPKQWEFWTAVMDDSQSGMVRAENCTRWLVDMRG